MKKLLAIIIMMSLMMPMIQGAIMKIYPSDDAQISISNSNTNYGTSQDLGVGMNGIRGKYRSLLKFDLANLSGKTIVSANFSIEPNNNQNSPSINLYLVPTNVWTETTVKWNNQPAYTSLIGNRQIIGMNRASFNIVPSYLNDTKISFILIEDGENQFAQFFSKEYYSVGGEEDNSRKPYITISYTAGSSCTTNADTSGDGRISMSELLAYMSGWKSGSVTMSSLLQAIGYWKAGAGC